jgi:hypothetical protein
MKYRESIVQRKGGHEAYTVLADQIFNVWKLEILAICFPADHKYRTRWNDMTLTESPKTVVRKLRIVHCLSQAKYTHE